MRNAILCLLALLVCLTSAHKALAADEKYSLRCNDSADQLTRAEVKLSVGGSIKLKDKAQTKTLPMSVEATQKYDQRILTAGSSLRAARFYDQADATIKIEQGGENPRLSDEHKLMVAELKGGRIVLQPVSGNLSREELDLIDVSGNSLLLREIMPSELVKLGDTWQIKDDAIAAILGIDAVTTNTVHCALGQVAGGEAQISMIGEVTGIVAGAKTTIELKARCHLQIQSQRVTWFALALKEQRAIGPVGPGLEITAKLTLRLTPITESAHLDEAALASARAATPERALLAYKSPKADFDFLHDRRWYVTTAEDKLTVLRMVEKGELVAQCNISPLPAVSPEKPSSLQEFQTDVQRSLGENFGQFLRAREGKEGNRRILRVIAQGEVSQLVIQWIYYLLTDFEGRQVSLAFTLEENQAEKFGKADQDLVTALSIATPTAQTAQRPNPAPQQRSE